MVVTSKLEFVFCSLRCRYLATPATLYIMQRFICHFLNKHYTVQADVKVNVPFA